MTLLAFFFFLVNEGWEDPNTTISGLSSARKQNIVKTPFCWHADDGQTLKAGLVALNGHSKIDKTKVLMTNGSLMKVERIAECTLWSILQYF